MPAAEVMHDVCIIGAGPAGLAVLSSLHSKRGFLTENQVEREVKHKKHSSASGAPAAAAPALSVCVVDPSDCWMCQWNGRFEALGIKTLRSPAFATPHTFTDAAIMEYAFKTGRTAELYDPDISETNAAKHLTHKITAGLFRLPGSQLFADFCRDHAASLPHEYVCGKARDVDKDADGTYRVNIDPAKGKGACGCPGAVRARRVIFALGAANSPNVPRLFLSKDIVEQQAKAKSPCVVHTNSWQDLNSLPFANEVVVVVGGGLSAAQAALLAARKGARQVVMVSRRKLEGRMYDLPLAWMNPQSGWRVAAGTKNNKKKKKKKFRNFEFYSTAKEERLAWIRSARGGATVPREYLDDLARAEERGRIQLHVDEVAAAEMCRCGEAHPGAVRLSFQHGLAPITADRVLLATGSVLDATKVPLLRNVASRFDVPLLDGLPDVDMDMRWGDQENFVVAGALAMLQVGPDAGNLTGCRRCAEAIANAFGVFDSFTEKMGPLANDFSALNANKGGDASGDEASDAESECDDENCGARVANNAFSALMLDSDSE